MAPKIKKQFEEFQASDIKAWRGWLERNHHTSEGLWLILTKKDSGLPSVNLDDAIGEALCFGWIDSLPNKLDEKRFKVLFSPRNPKSNWSRVNKERMNKLLERNRVQPAGQKMIDLAKKSGTWTALDDIENLLIPPDLATALDENPPAKINFDAFPRSVKRGILEWIFNAKRQETRAKRIHETATQAAQNIRANQFRRQKNRS